MGEMPQQVLTPITIRLEEIEGDAPTDDTLIVASRADLGGVATGVQLQSAVLTTPIPGLVELVISTTPGGAYPVDVQEIAGDVDTEHVLYHIPKAAFGGADTTPGTEYQGFRVDREGSGPALIFFLG